MTSSSGSPVDAVVVGSGPNGLAAAIEIARAGYSVRVLEAAATPGGGTRSAELTLPGFVHDVCSTTYPFGRISPFFASTGLAHRVTWIEPPASVGHPLDDGTAVLVVRDVAGTARGFDNADDARAYERLLGPIVRHWDTLISDALAPFHVPSNPVRAAGLAHFGLSAIQSATSVARRFDGERARAVFAGAAAHSIISLTEPLSAAAGLLMLTTAHRDGWPLVAGGAGQIADALVAELASLGGAVETDHRVTSLDDLPPHRVALFDVGPKALAAIAGDALPSSFRRRLSRYRYGGGVFKIDAALDGPIPWRAAELARAGTVHLGGTFEEIVRAEGQVARGRTPESPFVLLAQQTLFDPGRAPEDRHTVWAYCHVPNASPVDMTEAIVAQVERFAPGFRDRILELRSTAPADLEAANPNDVGGDIAGGRIDLRQLFTRPSLRVLDPYSTPNPSLFICSASTPPGGGVHGMCGALAARSALRRLRSGA
ncbi:MAG TPA: NAD(P)/FAD-dependent oxidoreductase [Candidatus Limnocylindrales bacterium]|nr:NAD(P)/FAD-dependent oxidoreductase [Candidatus Limnocylindrales bacterium]